MEKVIESNILINKMIATLGELPASPQIVNSVMKLASDPDADVNKMEKLLAADPSLSAKLLKLSNSTFYGQRKSVSTLKQAIIIIGFYSLRSLVVAASIHSLYGNKRGNNTLETLWKHSLATAMTCRLVANKINHKHPEEAFMGGLLHDIGKMVMIQKVGRDYEGLIRSIEKEKLNFHNAEEEELGFTHCDVGMMLLSKWNLPQELINSVYNHHSPELPENQAPEQINASEVPLEYLIQFSNEIAKRCGYGFDDNRVDSLNHLLFMQVVEMQMDEVEELGERLVSEFEHELSLFE